MSVCTCPPGSAITTAALPSCFEDFGKIEKLLFQRVYSTGTTKNSFTIATANPNLLASWTPFLSASDGTKVLQSSQIDDLLITPGDPRTVGGGNASFGGTEQIKGANPSAVEGNMYKMQQGYIEKLKTLKCEVSLGVYLVNEYGQIGGINDDQDSPTLFYPIPIVDGTFFIGDKGFGGFENRDYNMIRWQFAPNWSDKFHIVTASDFNPLDKLATS